MVHVVMYSGGVGSWASAKRVKEKYPDDKLVLLFADTLTEHEDLYRFLIETAADIFGVSDIDDLLERARNLPPVYERNQRCVLLPELADDTMARIPGLYWISDGRDIWDVFFDEHILGNSYIAPCSKRLKQLVCRKWVESMCMVEHTLLHVGIDWSEDQRLPAIIKGWAPYTVSAPMMEEPLLMKHEMLDDLEKAGIRRPWLYSQGYAHNNCGGFCVRSGQAQMRLLLQTQPEVFKFHESMEQKFRDKLFPDAAILKERNKVTGIVEGLTLAEVRRRIENQSTLFDANDWGGCGCFVTEEVEEDKR